MTNDDLTEDSSSPEGVSRRTLVAMSALVGLAGYVAADQYLAPAAFASVPFPLTNHWAGRRISASFRDHLNRPVPSVAPGVDFELSVGTAVRAPAAGNVTYTTQGGDGGYIATVNHPQGFRSRLMHLSGFEGTARSVAMGTIIGYSGGRAGAPGAGSSTGPHLHWSLVNPSGQYIDPLPEVNSNGSPSTPVKRPKEPDVMYLRYLENNKIVALNSAKGEYRYLSSFEVLALNEEVKFGFAIVHPCAEPQWTQTLGPLRGVSAGQSHPA